MADREGWRTISCETQFADAHLTVAAEMVRTPAQSEPRSWLVVHRKAAVVVAPMTVEGNLILIRQERIPIRSSIWEVPAGQVDVDEAIETVALRELREETGYELAARGELLPLGYFFSSPGFTDEHAYLFLARHVEWGLAAASPSESESIVDCRSFNPREIARMIANGEIRDANTLAVCARMVASGLLSFYG